MKTIHQGLITLVRSAITGEKLPLPEDFSLEAADELIRSQSLLPMIYRGAYQCGIPAKLEIMRQYQVQYCQSLVSSDKQLRAAEQLFRAFEENGIDYMPLKGCNLKKLYPRPELRIMGDADVLIRLGQYGQIKPLMKALQYEEAKESSYDFCWQGANLYLELHKRLFSPNQTDLCGYFGDGWDRANKGEGYRYDLSKEDEYVYIFTHMAKHFRFCGIGARHIVDLYVYRQKNPDMNEALIEKAMKRLRLLEFYRNIRRLLAVWFEDAPGDELTDYITEYVFSSGSFGTMENKLYSEEVIKSRKEGEIRNSRMKSLFSALFPSLKLMQLSYNVLYKYPILYPAFWPVRWVDVLLHRRKNIGRKMKIIRGMTDEKVSAHQQAFNFMGLDFDYGDEG